MSTALIYDPLFLKHLTPEGHPESPNRLTSVLEHLQTLDWYKDIIQLKSRDAAVDEVALVHDRDYISRVKKACQENKPFIDTQDVGICAESYDIALRAAGSAMELADQVMSGAVSNGFALLRPPGHHAERNEAMGFCIFNNIAIVAEYIKKKYSLERILIFDFDIHHGNGTQHIFENRADIFYISMHQDLLYPGTGKAEYTGYGEGNGATLNCPIASGGGDLNYRLAYDDLIDSRIHDFKPQCILISAGFDGHAMDPLATMNLTVDGFGWLTKKLCKMAKEYSNGKVISLLEGGYDLTALPLCVAKHLQVLRQA